jgi:hypothetical protein
VHGSSWLLSSILHLFLVTVDYARETFFSPICHNRRSFFPRARANHVYSRSSSTAKQLVEFFRIFVHYVIRGCTQKPHILTSHFGLPLLNIRECIIYILRKSLWNIYERYSKKISLIDTLVISTSNIYQHLRESMTCLKWEGVLNYK